jgi:hypothetical protein
MVGWFAGLGRVLGASGESGLYFLLVLLRAGLDRSRSTAFTYEGDAQSV